MFKLNMYDYVIRQNNMYKYKTLMFNKFPN